MMKLSLLALSISISNAANCDVNTQLSNTCGSITFAGVNNGNIDGTYNRIDDGLFEKQDGSRYISYYLGSDDNGNPVEYYIGNSIGDKRCARRSGSHSLRIEAADLDNINVGDEVELTSDFPSGREITITCVTESGVQAPEPEPISGVGSLCLSTDFTGTIGDGLPLSQLAGQYLEIPGGLNGKPAYKLVNSGSDCNVDSTFLYVPNLSPPYVFASDPNNPVDTFYFGCDNGEEIAANDISGCVGNIGDLVTLTEGDNCQCGLKPVTPAPVTPAPTLPASDRGSLCLSTSYGGTLNSGSGLSLAVADVAGQYEELATPINGKKAYKLVSACGTESTLAYFPLYSKYMFVKDTNDVGNTYYFSCSNINDIASNNVNGLCGGSLQSILSLDTVTAGMGCGCGLS